MPRARNNENRGYPKSWRFRYDVYYYRVPKCQEYLWDGKKEFRLGRFLSEAAAEWAKRVHRIEHDASVDALLTRYKLDVIPTKAAATRRGDMHALINLRKVFGAMRPRDVLPRHIYKYVDTRVCKNGEKSRATGLQGYSDSTLSPSRRSSSPPYSRNSRSYSTSRTAKVADNLKAHSISSPRSRSIKTEVSDTRIVMLRQAKETAASEGAVATRKPFG